MKEPLHIKLRKLSLSQKLKSKADSSLGRARTMEVIRDVDTKLVAATTRAEVANKRAKNVKLMRELMKS